MAIRPIRWAATGVVALTGFAAALIIPALLCAAFSAYPAAVPESVRAVLFVSGLIAVSTLTSLPAALTCAAASFAGFKLTGTSPSPHGYGTDAFLALTLVGIAAIVARRASRTRKEVEAIRVGATTDVVRRELAELLASQPTERAVAQAAVEFLEERFRMPAALWLGGRGYVREGRAPQMGEASPGPGGVARSEEGWFWVPIHDSDGALGLRPRTGRTLEPSVLGLMRSLGAAIVHVALRARLTRELEEERAASESERLCTALLASVAHDLRTPLTTIMASADMLRGHSQSLPAEDQDGLLENIQSEGRRLDEYIQNLVDVSKLGRGEIEEEMESVRVDELIGSAVSRLRRHHREANVHVEVDPELPTLRVHGPLLEQALFNLLHNAAKFSPPGSRIAVSATREPAGDVCLEVVDEGPGIPRQERERVFEMFYSTDRDGEKRAGTGLGLAISQSIVRAHGGEVRAEHSAVGPGTVMRILLPQTVVVAA